MPHALWPFSRQSVNKIVVGPARRSCHSAYRVKNRYLTLSNIYFLLFGTQPQWFLQLASSGHVSFLHFIIKNICWGLDESVMMKSPNQMHEARGEHTLKLPRSSSNFGVDIKTQSSWRLLFYFTKRNHFCVLSAALASTAVVATLRTLLSVVLGRIFDIISEFGRGTRTGHSAQVNVSAWCLVLVGMGIGNWLANTSLLSLWVVFGELQASEIYRNVFTSLLSERTSWFASLKDGVEGLHVRIHT